MGKEKSILVVEDDPDMRITIVQILKREGFNVLESGTGEAALNTFKTSQIDLILLDICLPDIDGITLAREFRSHSEIPIIMVTGKHDVIDRVVGLEIGADDYLTKPFHNRELTARIHTVLRRSAPAPKPVVTKDTNSEILYFDDWKIDLSACTFHNPSGKEVKMTTYEFRILSTLVTHPNHALSRNQIADLMGLGGKTSDGRSIDMLVGKVRRKLADYSSDEKQYIKTIRNQGYMFAGRATNTPPID